MQRKRIAFVTSYPDSIYAKRLMKGIFSQSSAYGFDVLVFASMMHVSHFIKDYLEGEMNILELINNRRIDGIIVDTVSLTEDRNTMYSNRLLRIMEKIPSVPVVSIDMSLGAHDIAHTDDVAAFEEITRHIVEKHGCRDIAFLAGPEEDDVPVKRLEGFRRGMQSCGLEVNEDRVFHGVFWYNYGEEIADKVVNGEISLPEAFICSTDFIAIGLVNRLKKHGIRVPEDVLVTGYDGTAEAATNDPTITTFIPMSAHTAAEAVNMIARKIAPELEQMPVRLSSVENLVTCRSCGCVDHKDDIISQFDLSMIRKYQNYGDENVNENMTLNRLLSSYMMEQVNSAETSDECLKNISLHTYLLNPYERFCLVLREDWGDHESVYENGFPERMKLVLDTDKEAIICSDTEGVIIDTADLIPALDDTDEEPAVWYFTPVHYIRNMLGYTALKRRLDEKKGLDDVFSLWRRNMEASLEMIRVRNKLMGYSEKDELTGLYNRRGMDRWIKEQLKSREESRVSVFVIDMDGLKYINDNFGHKEGDISIRAISSALQNNETKYSITVRTGGDEFCMMLLSEYPAEKKAAEIEEAIERANMVADKSYQISASVGYAEGILTEENIAGLITEADKMMYDKKKSKRRNKEI